MLGFAGLLLLILDQWVPDPELSLASAQRDGIYLKELRNALHFSQNYAFDLVFIDTYIDTYEGRRPR